MKQTSKHQKSSKPAKKPLPAKGDRTKTDAKSKGLAAVDALLGKPGATKAGDVRVKAAPQKPGATAQKQGATAQKSAVRAEAAPPPSAPELTRFERSVARAEKGEPGPIRLTDLTLDGEATRHAQESGRVELYRKILRGNPSAQPGRPLVNIVGTGDHDLRFQLLTLHELVLAAKALGREMVQVLLVRLSPAEAAELMTRPDVVEVPAAAAKPLSPREIAAMNGFLELPLKAIVRSENLRQEIDQDSPEFLNLVESVRTIGLQNPPVVEVREQAGKPDQPLFVCVSGHRRLLALESLGVPATTCALKTFKSERHRALAGLAENINRADLHFLDKADGYGLLIKQGMTAQEIAALLDADLRTVGKYVRASAWDPAVKARIRGLGSKATTRFLLNMLAAGERTTAELHALIDRFIGNGAAPAKPARGAELKKKLDDFYALSSVASDQRAIIEKALRFLGFMR